MKNFGEFFINQIEHAGTIVLSRTDEMSEEKIAQCIQLIRQHNEKATIITTPWDSLEGQLILDTIEGVKDLEKELMEEVHKQNDHEHHHDHHHDHGEHCCCGGHHHHDEDHECHHDHHHHDEDHECHHDHDHHEHDEHCTCGCHDHNHHGHHHADEVFTSFGLETPATFEKEEIEAILGALEQEETYGFVLRAKGMVPSNDGTWIYFDYVPGESDVREGKPDVTGKICVIGSKLNEEHLKQLFERN